MFVGIVGESKLDRFGVGAVLGVFGSPLLVD